ncbi:hypothetical protein AB1N83_013532 [Pleurotus pulmonarius]
MTLMSLRDMISVRQKMNASTLMTIPMTLRTRNPGSFEIDKGLVRIKNVKRALLLLPFFPNMDTPTTPLNHSNKRPAPTENDTPLTKKQQQDPIIHVGYHFMRTVEAFILPSVIIEKGLLRADELDEDINYTEFENQCWYAYSKLIEMSTCVDRRLDAGASAASEVGKLLQQGSSSAKSIDTSGIKTNIPTWWSILSPESPPIPKTKTARGFNNDVTGQLLCPVALNWQDPETKRKLREGTATIDGRLVNGGDWPNFLYMIPYDPRMPWVGLFQGPLLVKAFRHVFTSPSSAQVDENATDTGSSTQSGNAQLHGMTKVTTGSIAYIATQVSFALSSNTTFSRNARSLDSTTFYNSIIAYLRDPENALETKELLKWWDKRIFRCEDTAVRGNGNGSRNAIKAARLAAAAAAQQAT